MNETGIKQLNSRTSSQLFTEQHRKRARQIQNIASSITLYAEGYGVPTELSLEMLRYPGTRQVHSTDEYYGW